MRHPPTSAHSEGEKSEGGASGSSKLEICPQSFVQPRADVEIAGVEQWEG